MSDLVDHVVEAMKAPELECGPWHPNYLRELACAAIKAVGAYDLANSESDPKVDQKTGQRSEELREPFARPGVWTLF